MLMAIPCLNLKNTGMPSRHISPQSFDEILSELGDDPAIPDPHGIRKTSPPKSARIEPQNQSTGQINLEALKKLGLPNQVQKLGLPLAFGVCAITLCLALLMAYESLKTSSETLAQGSRQEISDLKKEFALLRNELEREQDSLYEAIEFIEVSVHLLKENKATSKANIKPQAHPFESELRRWRYLGLSQMGGAQQAFFHTGKSNVMHQKGMLVLGDWRLTHLEKEFATLTHSQGKTLSIKPSKSE